MNTCPYCGRESNSSKPRCSSCPVDIENTQQVENKAQNVIEPEVVRTNNSNYNQSQTEWSNEQSGSGFKMWTFQQYGGLSSRGNGSCLPGFITLGIALSLGFQFGLLATIGFLVFYAIGSAISFVVTMRRVVEGKLISLWFTRVVVWLVSAFITVSLAG